MKTKTDYRGGGRGGGPEGDNAIPPNSSKRHCPTFLQARCETVVRECGDVNNGGQRVGHFWGGKKDKRRTACHLMIAARTIPPPPGGKRTPSARARRVRVSGLRSASARAAERSAEEARAKDARMPLLFSSPPPLIITIIIIMAASASPPLKTVQGRPHARSPVSTLATSNTHTHTHTHTKRTVNYYGMATTKTLCTK